MTETDLIKTAENLAQRIAGASASGRLALQPELHRLVCRLKAKGQPVPRRLQKLDIALCEEQVEAQFDNLPV